MEMFLWLEELHRNLAFLIKFSTSWSSRKVILFGLRLSLEWWPNRWIFKLLLTYVEAMQWSTSITAERSLLSTCVWLKLLCCSEIPKIMTSCLRFCLSSLRPTNVLDIETRLALSLGRQLLVRGREHGSCCQAGDTGLQVVSARENKRIK